MAGIVAWHVPTTTLFGFSSAAELLVFTAGYAFVLANRRRLETGGLWAVQHHAALRALWLLAANALMLVAVCAVLTVFRFQPAAGHRGFWQSLLAPPEAWLATLGHLAKPMPTLFTFDVLPLYALLLLAAPLAKAHLRRNPAWVVGISVALYGLACTGPLGHKGLGIDGESFNPLAWQVLFVAGMLAASRRWFREPPSYRLLPYVLGIVGLGFVWALSYRYPLDLPWLPHMPHLPMTAHADIGLLPILLGITMWMQQKLNPAPTDASQKMIFAWMPWVFMFMLGHFASGLVLYYITNNTITFIQQYIIMRSHGHSPDIFGNIRSSFKRGKPAAK